VDRHVGRYVGCTVVAIVLGVALPAEAAPPAAPPAVLRDDALLKHDADLAPAAAGSAVEVGDTVRAPDRRAATVALADGVTLRLLPGAQATLHAATYLPAERAGSKPARAYQLDVGSGSVSVFVPSGKTPPAGIVFTLPHGASLAMWHGTAELTVQGDRAGVVLDEGVGIAGGGGAWRSILSGDTAVYNNGQVELHRAPLRAPVMESTPSDRMRVLALTRDAQRVPLSLDWKAVDGAASYLVEVTKDEAMHDAVSSEIVAGPPYATEALPPGTYFGTVRTVSNDGLIGPRSIAQRMRIIDVRLPPAAVVARDEAIVLPQSGALTLSDPTALEVAYTSTADPSFEARWSPAVRELRLGGEPGRFVRIRVASSHVEAGRAIHLVERQLRARVDLSPKGARWPEQPVDIVVRAYDPSGRLDASHEVLVNDVQIGLEDVAVIWHHVGDSYRARIEPRIPPGPWVVRVHVRDASGDVIGAGLLEVDGPRLSGAGKRTNDSTEVTVTH
jgi:hypothetical protein